MSDVSTTPLLRGSATRRDTDNVLPYRRRGGKVRRSRRSPLVKWLKPLLAASAIVGIPTALVAWPMMSSRFALQEMVIETGERVSEQWVRQALAPLAGQNLPRISLERAEARLRRHPWVESSDLRKELPASLNVRVREKRAVALLRDGKQLYYLDADGEPITLFDPSAPGADLLLISRSRPGADLRPAVRLAEEIEREDPFWRPGLSEIEILGEQDFRLHTTKLPFPLLVRSGTLAEKSSRLEELLPRISGRYGALATVDLRFARRIIVQPSVSASGKSAAADTGKATADHA
ncbi:MAG: FtsQ-type POTRA domain-containing protein [bacterium]|nr:FtsQ-type POTRA domain-containing protein [bacterium]